MVSSDKISAIAEHVPVPVILAILLTGGLYMSGGWAWHHYAAPMHAHGMEAHSDYTYKMEKITTAFHDAVTDTQQTLVRMHCDNLFYRRDRIRDEIAIKVATGEALEGDGAQPTISFQRLENRLGDTESLIKTNGCEPFAHVSHTD